MEKTIDEAPAQCCPPGKGLRQKKTRRSRYRGPFTDEVANERFELSEEPRIPKKTKEKALQKGRGGTETSTRVFRPSPEYWNIRIGARKQGRTGTPARRTSKRKKITKNHGQQAPKANQKWPWGGQRGRNLKKKKKSESKKRTEDAPRNGIVGGHPRRGLTKNRVSISLKRPLKR